MSFAEGSKKKDTASHKKVNVKVALQEIFAEELEQFNFKKDFEIADEQFVEIYTQTIEEQDFYNDLTTAVKLFIEINEEDYLLNSYVRDLNLADKQFNELQKSLRN